MGRSWAAGCGQDFIIVKSHGASLKGPRDESPTVDKERGPPLRKRHEDKRTGDCTLKGNSPLDFWNGRQAKIEQGQVQGNAVDRNGSGSTADEPGHVM